MPKKFEQKTKKFAVPKLRWLEIRGFRAFGNEAQRLEFSTNFAIICGPNSQGKTSIAEAFEFLLTGATVRREFLASAKAEFCDSLRNAYLPEDGEVCVQAGIEDSAGVVHVASRKLLSDYTAMGDCQSLLTIDGHVASNLESLGLSLSEPPLRAPVLLQHTLRYVLSARPSDRSEYFKALLEISDLELIRATVTELISQADVPQSLVLSTFRKCARISSIETIMRKIGDDAPQGPGLEEALTQALGIVATQSGFGGGLPEAMVDRARILEAILENKRRSAFPLDVFATAQGNLQFDVPTFAKFHEFGATVREIAKDVSALTELYSALLSVPSIAGSNVPIDCPICNTPRSLTPSRLEEIRKHVANSAGVSVAKTLAEQEILELQDSATAIRSVLTRITPEFASWDDTASLAHREIISRILPETGPVVFDELVGWLPGFHQALSDSRRNLVELQSAANTALQAVRAFDQVTSVDLTQRSIAVAESTERVQNQLEIYLERVRTLTVPLRQEIDRQANLEGWQELLDLVENIPGLQKALTEAKARALVRSDIEGTLTLIDQAKASVFDENFSLLSDEIEHWWKKVRPDESVAFGGLRRRGTGRRFVDVKAILFTDSRVDAFERDAAGIFSDSQLNCFGLSAFLARCVREKCPIIVLDDPVSASDAAHRATFAHSIPRELLRSGAQVVAMTFDETLSRLIQDYYSDLPADCFSISMGAPEIGPEIVKTSDTLEALLASARPFIRNQNREIRKVGARHLRDAAERLCKEIIAKNRSTVGTIISIAELGGTTLTQLVPDAEPYLTRDLSHPGKLRVIGRLLNPGSHDTPPPDVAELSVAFGDMVKLKRDYL